MDEKEREAVTTERRELAVRIKDLEDHLYSDAFKARSAQEQGLIVAQFTYMQAYCGILSRRLSEC